MGGVSLHLRRAVSRRRRYLVAGSRGTARAAHTRRLHYRRHVLDRARCRRRHPVLVHAPSLVHQRGVRVGVGLHHHRRGRHHRSCLFVVVVLVFLFVVFFFGWFWYSLFF